MMFFVLSFHNVGLNAQYESRALNSTARLFKASSRQQYLHVLAPLGGLYDGTEKYLKRACFQD